MSLSLKDDKIFLSKKKFENTKQIFHNSSVATSMNFHKKQNKDIMDKIKNLHNDKENKENYETCYFGSNNKTVQSNIHSPIRSAGNLV